jgi:PAB-dependent poly(A)-specific ribonuclease subunit 2
MIFEVGAPPPKIDSSIINTMSQTNMGFVAKNPKTKRRYQVEDTRQSDRASDSLTAPKFLSEKARAAQSSSESDFKTAETMQTLTDMHLDDVTRKEVPAMYGNVEIKYSKFGVDDFDFAYVSQCSKFPVLALTFKATTIKHHSPALKLISQTHMPIRYFNYVVLLH